MDFMMYIVPSAGVPLSPVDNENWGNDDAYCVAFNGYLVGDNIDAETSYSYGNILEIRFILFRGYAPS